MHDPGTEEGGVTSVYEELVALGTEWADAQKVASISEIARKATFGAIVTRLRAEGKGLGEAEHMARNDPEYKESAENAAQAERDAIAARIVYYAKQTSFEAWRTLQANERAAQSADR